ncbi:MAG: hypothetical protein ACI9LN_000483 [Saprospiraceae bacterium]
MIEDFPVDSIHETGFMHIMSNNKIDTAFIKLYFDKEQQIKKKKFSTNKTDWYHRYFRKNSQIDSIMSTRISKDKHLIHKTTRHYIYDDNKNLVKTIKNLKISTEGVENYSKSTDIILIERDSLGLPIE